MRRFIFLGAPGAGKGTIAMLLSGRMGLLHISTGDLFREQIALRTPIGLAVRDIIAEGSLVPDPLTSSMIEAKLSAAGSDCGFVLDGFPRTLAQAEALTESLKRLNMSLDRVFLIQVNEKEIVKRISARRLCSACKQNYNLRWHFSGDPTTCPSCGGRLIQREDDREETVRHRLEVYRDSTEPLINYYKERSLLTVIQNEGDPPEAADQIMEYLAGDKVE